MWGVSSGTRLFPQCKALEFADDELKESLDVIMPVSMTAGQCAKGKQYCSSWRFYNVLNMVYIFQYLGWLIDEGIGSN